MPIQPRPLPSPPERRTADFTQTCIAVLAALLNERKEQEGGGAQTDTRVQTEATLHLTSLSLQGQRYLHVMESQNDTVEVQGGGGIFYREGGGYSLQRGGGMVYRY